MYLSKVRVKGDELTIILEDEDIKSIHTENLGVGGACSEGDGCKCYDAGFEDGKEEGYNAGLEDGEREGYDAGLEDGKEEGYNVGFEAGKDEYYEAGFEAGRKDR